MAHTHKQESQAGVLFQEQLVTELELQKFTKASSKGTQCVLVLCLSAPALLPSAAMPWSSQKNPSS